MSGGTSLPSAQALPVRPDLVGKLPYGAPQLPDAIQLNVNENPFPPSAALVDALAEGVRAAAASLNRYPDREALGLRFDLAAYLTRVTGVPLTVQQVWAANGSNEVLQQVCQAFGGPGRVALGFEPSYSMHPLLAAGTNTGWVSTSRAADFSLAIGDAVGAVQEHQPAITFLTTPNNPTGTVLGLDLIRAVHDASAGVVVVDEAYAEFGTSPSAVTLLADCPRLLVSRTMSKAFAGAGLRLGYLAASADVIDVLRLVRLPYHLSTLTQVAARVALAHTDELLGTVEAVKEQRDRMVEGIVALGLRTVPTESNFLLFGPFDQPSVFWQSLLDHGVLVRDVSGSPGLAGWLRVNAGTPDETTAFLTALEAVVR